MAETDAPGDALRLAQADTGATDAGENTAPDAVADCVVTAENTAFAVAVLDNDSDPDGDALNLLSTTQPASGEATINPDGSLTIAAQQAGLQTLRYQAGDGQGGNDFADVWVLVNAVAGELEGPVLEGLSDQQVAQLARACASGATALAVDAYAGPEVTVPTPEAGHRALVTTEPGQVIQLQGGAFAGASYFVVDGGLLVISDGGRIAFLAGLENAAASDAPPTLSVAGGPPVPTDALIAQLEPVGDETDGVGRVPTPEAGPEHGGGAGFNPFDPGDIPGGPGPLGPLGPTALGPGDEFLLRDPGDTLLAARDGIDGEDGENGNGGPPPIDGENDPPSITASPSVERELGEITVTPGFSSGPAFPELFEKEPLPLDQVNGVDPDNLTLGRGGDATIVFRSEVAEFTNALGVYLIDPASREIIDPQIVFSSDGVAAGEEIALSELYSSDQLAPETQFGLFVVSDGFALNGDLFGSDLAFVTEEGGPATVDATAPALVFVNPDGTFGPEVVSEPAGGIFHSFDADPSTPLVNPLNLLNPPNEPGTGQVVSGLLPAASGLTIGFEDKALNFGDDPDDPTFNFFDNDFNDVVVDVELAPERVATFAPGDIRVASDAVIEDTDDATLSRAEVAIVGGALPGDALTVDESLLDSTGISLSFGADARSLALDGTAPLETYVEILRSVVIDPGPIEGVRDIQLTVFDDDGGAGSVTVAVDLSGAAAEIGTDGPDDLFGAPLIADAIAGRGDDDDLFGDSGNDLLDGGTGNDFLDGGEGDDILVGGPGFDILDGGPGADGHVYTSLADRGDTILGFDATADDFLDFAALFDDPVDAGNIDEFVAFTEAGDDVNVSVDADGGGSDFASIAFLTLTDPTGVTTPEDAVTNGTLVV